MSFENPGIIKPKQEETKPNEPDDYDLAKKDLEEDKSREKIEESKDNPEETQEEVFKEEKEIGEKIKEQLEKEGGLMQEMGDWTREQIKERTANGKMLIAAMGMFAATTIFAGNFSKAEARGGRGNDIIGREVERAIGGIIDDAAKGIGEALGNIFRRGGSGETPREQERRIERERRKISEQDREYDRMKERITEKYTRSLQEERDEEGRVITEMRRDELLKNYIDAKRAVDALHKEQNHPEELCEYKYEQLSPEKMK